MLTIKRIRNGAPEWIARVPVNVLGDDGATVDHVECTWTADATAALDFTERATTRERARDLLQQTRGDFDPPLDPATLPRESPTVAEAPHATRTERRDTPEGIALRERRRLERLEAERKAAEEAALRLERLEAERKAEEEAARLAAEATPEA